MPCRITLIARAEVTIDAECSPDGAQDYVDKKLFENNCSWELTHVEIIEVQRNGSEEEH